MPNRSPANSSKPTTNPSLRLTKDLNQLGFRRIVGVDEVGRGALAGPVVVAAVELNRHIAGITDSKLLSALKRRTLAEQIHILAEHISFGSASNREIDELGLSQALRLAYERALAGVTADLILTDAYNLPGRKFCRAIQGDRLFYPVAAASIVAKVYRDQLMRIYAQFYPDYAWQTNAGYGTAKHLAAIKVFGISSLHRRSFLGKRAA